MPTVRYHPLLRLLHWASAALLLGMLFMAGVFLQAMPNADPNKIGGLRIHMAAGVLVLVLTLVRLVVRLRSAKPPAVLTGMAWADALAPWVHRALYALVLLMAASGMTLSLQAGLPDIVWAGKGTLPPDLHIYLPRIVHGIVSKLLMLAIAVHVGAALYHQLVRRDGLLRRMGWGPSSE
jgi:cytochrome b561